MVAVRLHMMVTDVSVPGKMSLAMSLVLPCRHEHTDFSHQACVSAIWKPIVPKSDMGAHGTA